MMSTYQIRADQQEAAERAASDGMVPFVYWKHDDLGPPFPFPNLGDYVPEGWELVSHFMADTSGFGSPDEPADTPEQLRERIERELRENPDAAIGWAIIEVGQFQVVIGQFRKTGGAHVLPHNTVGPGLGWCAGNLDIVEAIVEEVEFCGCTNEELEAGRTCGQDTCPNGKEAADAAH